MARSTDKKEAQHPFNKENATAILRSADGVAFRIQTAILADASPFFDDMFGLPQTPADKKQLPAEGAEDAVTDIPSIDVSEDSATLDKVLRYCYPGVPNPSLNTLDELRPVLEAVTKYQLEQALVAVRHRLADYATQDPVRVYALACRYELAEEARSAAFQTLQNPRLGKNVPELALIPASTYHNLLQYHQRCQRAASALTDDFSWVPQGVPLGSTDFRTARPKVISWDAGRQPTWFTCATCRDNTKNVRIGQQTLFVSRWWNNLMNRAHPALKERPRGETIIQPSLLDPVFQDALSCANCRLYNVLSEFRSFILYFANKVDEAVAEVQLDLDF